MAAIDKIYGSAEEWQQLHDYLETTEPEYLRYLYPKPRSKDSHECPLSNFPGFVDGWLMLNCPLDFVRERIREQYGYDRQAST